MYILPYKFGSMGTVAITEYIKNLDLKYYQYLILEPSALPQVISDNSVNDIVQYNKKTLVAMIQIFKHYKTFKPDIVHVIYSRNVFFFRLSTFFLFRRRTKWVFDVRSPLLKTGYKKLLHRTLLTMAQFFYSHAFTHAKESLNNILSGVY